MAARTLNRLTDRGIKALKEPGWYADGAGLYLRVLKAADETATPPKRWIFVYQWAGKRVEMGMGAYPDVSLTDARDGDFGRSWARDQLKAHRNPVEERRRLREEAQKPAQEVMTFRRWAEEVAPAVGPKAEKARKAWVAMMQEKVGALADLEPSQITTEHVLAALKPYWISRPESGKRMRQRIERVLDAARSKGLISGAWENPARLRGHLENLLPKRSTEVKHRAALPYAEAAELLAKVRESDRPAAMALEWCILTVVRNIEARYAVRREIDLDAKVWVIPKARMKGPVEKRREHRVPLTAAMVAFLDRLGVRDLAPDAPLFPSPEARDGFFSENALQNVLNDLGYKGRATVHGFRSTFKDWSTECTNFPWEISEMALAHVVGSDTERAYARSDALAKRAKLMEAWNGFLLRPVGSNVRQLGDVGRR